MAKDTIFCLSTGRSGTQYLTHLLRANLPESVCFHEILGYDRFGVDTPDLSHMTLFNSQGNIPQVRHFWWQKLSRVAASPRRFYAETSHLLMKAGLIENLDFLKDAGRIHLIVLERDVLPTVLSYRARADFRNRGNMWLWYLDPAYPKNLIPADPIATRGLNGRCIWYIYEIRARTAFYIRRLASNPNIIIHRCRLEDIRAEPHASALLAEFGVKGPVKIPAPQNVGGGIPVDAAERARIEKMVEEIKVDPERIAADAIRRGFCFDRG